MKAQHELDYVWSIDHCHGAQRYYEDYGNDGHDFFVHFIDLLVLFRLTGKRAPHARSDGRPGMQVPE